jgi:hypothetical protein
VAGCPSGMHPGPAAPPLQSCGVRLCASGHHYGFQFYACDDDALLPRRPSVVRRGVSPVQWNVNRVGVRSKDSTLAT